MIVCSCNQLTDRQVLESLTSETGPRPRSPGQVYRCLGCKPNCGRCVRQIRQLFQDIVHGECTIGCATCPGDAQSTPATLTTMPGQAPHTPAPQMHVPPTPVARDGWRAAVPAVQGGGRRGFVVPESQRYAPSPCCAGTKTCCSSTQQHPRPHNDDAAHAGLMAAE